MRRKQPLGAKQQICRVIIRKLSFDYCGARAHRDPKPTPTPAISPSARTEANCGLRSEVELIGMGLATLGEIFDLLLRPHQEGSRAARPINWGNDPFARHPWCNKNMQTEVSAENTER
jgi:hypothetical protein